MLIIIKSYRLWHWKKIECVININTFRAIWNKQNVINKDLYCFWSQGGNAININMGAVKWIFWGIVMDLEGFVKTLPWTSGAFKYDEKKNCGSRHRRSQRFSISHNIIPPWKTPRSCEREALKRKCERECIGTTIFSIFFQFFYSL